jgi:hypothetical protein
MELTPPFGLAIFCHCEYCRKQSGHMGTVAVQVPLAQVRVLAGEDLIEHFQLAPGVIFRFFCRRCGSSLYGVDSLDSDEIWVRMGMLDADPGVRPSRRLWVGSAPPWLPVPDDDLLSFEQRPF